MRITITVRKNGLIHVSWNGIKSAVHFTSWRPVFKVICDYDTVVIRYQDTYL